MLDEKSKGKEVTISAPVPQRGGKVVDIMEALKRSMERFPPREAGHGCGKEEKEDLALMSPSPTILVS